jgi:midasin
VLSRAFRNRFIEVHFEDIPAEELEEILEKRCALPPTWCKALVKVRRPAS